MADHTNLVLFWLIEAVLAVIIIIANGMTIIVLSLSRRLSRGYSNHLVLNLSIADLFTGFAYLYVSLTNFTVLVNNPMNKYACLLRMSSYYCAIAASFYATLAIAINRYVAIVYPLKYTKYVARRMVNAMIVVSWCAAVLISSVPLYWNNFDPEKGSCKNIISKLFKEVIWASHLMAIWLSIIILYLGIWKATRAHMERSKARSRGIAQNNHTSDSNCILVFLFLGCFSICWLPKVVDTLLIVFGVYNRSTALVALHHTETFMAMSNSIINPLIYSWKTPAYREAYERFFLPKAPSQNNELEKKDTTNKVTTRTNITCGELGTG